MATSVTLEADGKGEIIGGFLPHACSQLPHSQVMSLRFSPAVDTGESSYPLKVLPILQAAFLPHALVGSPFFHFSYSSLQRKSQYTPSRA